MPKAKKAFWWSSKRWIRAENGSECLSPDQPARDPRGELQVSHHIRTLARLLWRVHQQVPPQGYIGVFNRSHYEDVLVVRVNNLVPKSTWEKYYDHINHFERLLSDSGTTILKFYLHISKDEQKNACKRA